ncbi:hypothetical protein BCEP4_1680007 [Burkholderia cepacia]|nr:hypothetical protein BCEP4_1680007 [Burkholderia cepacia]
MRTSDLRACRDAGGCPRNGAETAGENHAGRGQAGEGEVRMRVLLTLWGSAIALAVCVAWLADRPKYGELMPLAARLIQGSTKPMTRPPREQAR